MMFFVVVGMKDFFCNGVFDVVRECYWVGIIVWMVIGDNVEMVRVVV